MPAHYYLRAEYAKVEPLYLEARAIRKKVLGRQHPDYAATLDNLAVFYSFDGEILQGGAAVP